MRIHRTIQYWLNIHSGYYDFERKSKDANLIEKTTKAEVLAYFREKISPSSSTRAKFSVHLQSQHVSKKTIEQVPTLLADAGVTEISEDLKTLLASTPTPLISEVEKAVAAELEKQQIKSEAKEKVLAAVRDSHTPTNLGDNKKILTNGEEVRKLMQVGPHSTPVDEYKELFAKL